ncbi:MAG: FIST C-terminal domain-containing protein [Synergistaceae bacterium]|nr:FIST C-terminal domain-containing protein [Synergistaceae bacterium]
MKALTAHTDKIDDVEAAVSEILEQLKPESGLLSRSIGILSCYADFVESGAMRAVCDALPFEVVGLTTLANVGPGSTGTMLLTLTVLTGDDVSFSVGLTAPLPSEDEAPLREEYEAARARLDRRPSLMLSFVPLLVNAGGDFFVNAFTKISGGVPNFGGLAVDHNSDYHDSCVVCNGEAYTDRYAFILLSGNVSPRFFMGSISAAKIFRERGIVTAANGNQLQTVNDVPVSDYLESLGFAKGADGFIVGLNSFPFVVDYNDGTPPVIRAIYSQTPEGHAVGGGNIPVGATLSIGSMNASEVVATAAETINAALSSGKSECFLIFSCVGRYFHLGYNPLEEAEKVQRTLDETGIPYHFAYSGGELCPAYVREGSESIVNRNHNLTFVICAL